MHEFLWVGGSMFSVLVRVIYLIEMLTCLQFELA